MKSSDGGITTREFEKLGELLRDGKVLSQHRVWKLEPRLAAPEPNRKPLHTRSDRGD